MATFKITNKDYVKIKVEGKDSFILKKNKFDEFNESILGLGNIRTKPSKIDALSAIFDLEGFTNFCNQRDPELSVSLFLNDFLEWIFKEIKAVQIIKKYDEGYTLHANLPFLSKYLGDGILFLWDAENMNDIKICNSIVLLRKISAAYRENFYPEISKKMIAAPPILRCGIAKGTVFSVGNGNDYVGSCINVSARLQKLHGLTFSFSTIGIDYNKGMTTRTKKLYLQKKVNIRGIGEEIICVLKREFNSLDSKDQKHFTDV